MMTENEVDALVETSEKHCHAYAGDYHQGVAATELAIMSLKHCSGGAEAAGRLLLAMQRNTPFELSQLLRFDRQNSVNAKVLLDAYRPHDIWPSKWMMVIGIQGTELMQAVYEKWESKL